MTRPPFADPPRPAPVKRALAAGAASLDLAPPGTHWRYTLRHVPTVSPDGSVSGRVVAVAEEVPRVTLYDD